MKNLDLKQMQQMQKDLQEKYKDKWPILQPRVGRDKLLWMMIEAGETADIIKKCGDQAIMEDASVRRKFVEEMSDTLMYFNDVMLCYDISPQELQEIYLEKHYTNMGRW